MMQRLIVTGANGSGKSTLAAQLHALRPDIPLVSFDAIKLTRNWQQKPRSEIDRELLRVVAAEAWVIEGGPSLLSHALPRAEAVIWLDPPEVTRIWRLLKRPWRNLGKTRPELPAGNVEWPFTQYRFAFQSLRTRAAFRQQILDALNRAEDTPRWHCRSKAQLAAVVEVWGKGRD